MQESAPAKWALIDLLAKAEGYIDTFDFELAEKFAQRALDQSPEHVDALQVLASVRIELGDRDAAKGVRHAMESSYFS